MSTAEPRSTADAPGSADAPGPSEATRHPVDWAFAARTAATLAPAGPRFTAREARRETEGLRAAAEASLPHVRRLTGLTGVDAEASEVLVVDRATWSAAAARSFAGLLDPTFAHLRATRPREYAATTHSLAARAAALEMGGILAWLSARVLGQYDPFAALAAPEGAAAAPGGRLLLNAPTIAQVRTELNVDPADFRMWVCLHEQTHRVQFAAAPWLRTHLRAEVTALATGLFDRAEDLPGRLRQALAAANPLGRGGREAGDDVVGAGADPRGPQTGAAWATGPAAGGLGLLGSLQGEAERERIGRLTAAMSLLEGHANVVMDGVDASVVSSVKTIRRRFTERGHRRSPLDRLVRRLLGMDAKLAQYRDGQRFVEAAVAALGMDGFNVVWDAPELLPDLAELHDPDAWVRRVRTEA